MRTYQQSLTLLIMGKIHAQTTELEGGSIWDSKFASDQVVTPSFPNDHSSLLLDKSIVNPENEPILGEVVHLQF